MKEGYNYKEKGIINAVVSIAVAVIIIGLVTSVGLAIMSTASVTAQTSVNSLPTATQVDANSALKSQFTNVSTVSGYYPLLFLAIIGGIAVAAFVGIYAGGGKLNGGGSGAM